MRRSVAYPAAVVYSAIEAMESRVSVKQSALPDAVPAIRAAVSRFLEPLNVEPARLADILLAVTEACGNVVRHAYRNQLGAVRCDGSITNSQIILSVYDWGVAWETPSQNPGAGLGIPLMQHLADQADRSSDGHTKRLDLRFAISDRSTPSTEHTVPTPPEPHSANHGDRWLR
jgi:anti-sigma regulatory factor (Ser/Thr protein kinase)